MLNAWLEQWFDAQQAQQGGVIRRDRYYVDKFSSMAEVIREANKRGWHVLEIGDQVIILCNDGNMTVHC